MSDMSAAALGGSSGFYGGGGLEASAQAQLYAFYSNHALQNPSLLAQMQQQNAIQQQRNNYEPRVWHSLTPPLRGFCFVFVPPPQQWQSSKILKFSPCVFPHALTYSPDFQNKFSRHWNFYYWFAKSCKFLAYKIPRYPWLYWVK